MSKYVVSRFGDRVVWCFPAPSGRFADAQTFETGIEPVACRFCTRRAITELPPPLLAQQPDGTTHVCNPLLGGCNHGFVKDGGQ